MEEICSACLTSDRTLTSLNGTDYFLIYSQILEEISVCSREGGVRVCWECMCVLRRWTRFKRDVQQATIHLMQNGLCSRPPPQSLSRLDRHTLHTGSYCAEELYQDVKGDHSDYDVSLDDMPVTFADELQLPGDISAHDDKHDKLDNTHKRKTKKNKFKLKSHKTKKKIKEVNTPLKTEPVTTEESDLKIPLFNLMECIQNSEIPVSNLTKSIQVSEISATNKTLSEQESVRKGSDGKNKSDLGQQSKNETTENKGENTEKPHCDICNKKFSSKKTYSYHMSTLHSGGGKHECAECGRRYQWRSNLARHTRTHKALAAGELYCNVCDKKFASVATFRTHLALSSKHITDSDKPYVCEECGVRFVNKTRLRDHVDWEHLHKIKFNCDLCDKPFKSHTSLYIHMNNVHINKGRKDHLCHICGKAYQNVCKLRSHVSARHGAAPAHRCTCGAAFTWHSSYYRHHRHCASKSPSKKSKKRDKEMPTENTPS